MCAPLPASAYPSPPSLSPTPIINSPTYSTSSPSTTYTMGATEASVDGVGVLNYQRAIDIARNTEGDLDPSVSEYLENAVSEIWVRINDQPDSYILSKDEFAVFNYYRQRFQGDVAQNAVDRYWRSAQAGESGHS